MGNNEKIDNALAELDKVHEAMMQFSALAFSLKTSMSLPYLPPSADLAISGLSACNAARAKLLAMKGGD